MDQKQSEESCVIKYIGITGVAGSGKDTFASCLASHLGEFKGDLDFTVETFHFADPLKDSLSMLLGVERQLLDKRYFKESTCPLTNKTYRSIMQEYGMWVRTNFGHDFWIKRIEQEVESFLQFDNNYMETVIIPDVRFPNEAAFIREKDGLLIKVVRPDNPDAIDGSHESERHIKDMSVDCIILNIGDLSALERKAERIASTLKM